MLLSTEETRRAEALLEEARALSEQAGMTALLDRIDRLRAERTTNRTLPDGLSPREAEVLILIAKGLSNRELATELSISQHTAANHVKNILRKTRSANRTEAASYAHTHGLVEA